MPRLDNAKFQYGLIKSFFSECKKINYKKGQIIIRPGLPCLGMYYIEEGYIKVFTETSAGEDQILMINQKDDCFPFNIILGNCLTHIYCECISDCVLRYVEKEKIEEYLLNNTRAFHELYFKALNVIKRLMMRVENLSYPKASIKIIFKLLFLVQSYGLIKENSAIIKLPINQNDFAKSIALTRETVSRELEKLEKQKLIEHRNKTIIVKDINGLKNILGQWGDISWFN